MEPRQILRLARQFFPSEAARVAGAGRASYRLWATAAAGLALSCAQSAPTVQDPLPSWNDTAPKKAIVAFVERVTTEGSPDFVPVPERIATFDNDGTLWSEKPVPFQLLFAFDQVKALAPQHPEWKTQASRSRRC